MLRHTNNIPPSTNIFLNILECLTNAFQDIHYTPKNARDIQHIVLYYITFIVFESSVVNLRVKFLKYIRFW